MRFDTQTVALVAITANGANTAFTVTSAGTYLVNVAMYGFIRPVLEVNGVGVGPVLPPGSGESQVINASAGDVITVVNTSGSPLA